MPRKRNPVLVMADAMDGLVALVAELNRTTKHGEWAASAVELRGIVKQWQDSGPNMWKLIGANPGLWVETVEAFRPSLIPTKSGNMNMRLLDNAGAPGVMVSLGERGIRFYAVVWFNMLTLNPLWKKLGGPCARCDKYFVKSRLELDKYCPKSRCSSIASADKANRNKLEHEQKEKLARAEKLIEKWDALKHRPKMSWKRWVSDADQTITPKWLTRAINPDPDIGHGLQPPMKEGSYATGKN
jgi:hypothetical protein